MDKTKLTLGLCRTKIFKTRKPYRNSNNLSKINPYFNFPRERFITRYYTINAKNDQLKSDFDSDNEVVLKSNQNRVNEVLFGLKESDIDLELISQECPLEDSYLKQYAVTLKNHLSDDSQIKTTLWDDFWSNIEHTFIDERHLSNIYRTVIIHLLYKEELNQNEFITLLDMIQYKKDLKLLPLFSVIIERVLVENFDLDSSIFIKLLRLGIREESTIHVEKLYYLISNKKIKLEEKLFIDLITYFSHKFRVTALRRIRDDLKADPEQLSCKIYSSLLLGFGRNELLPEVIELYRDFEKRGIAPNGYILGPLIYAFGKKQKIKEVESIYQALSKTDVGNPIKLNGIILYSLLSDPEKALNWYNEVILRSELEPNLYIYNVLIQLHLQRNDLKSAMQVKDEMIKKAIKPNWITYCCLIKYYSRIKDIESIEGVLEMMDVDGIKPTIEVFNLLINAYLNLNQYEKAKVLFDTIPQDKLITTTHYHFLRYYCNRNEYDMMMKQFETIKQHQLPLTNAIYDTILHSLFKRKNVSLMLTYFNEMKLNNLAPDLPIYNTMLKGMALYSDVQSTVSIFESMLSATPPVYPNIKSYNYLIYAYLKDNQIKTAELLMKELLTRYPQNAQLRPDTQTLSFLLRGLGKAKQLPLMEEYYVKLTSPPLSIKPDLQTLESIMFGYYIHRDYVKATAVYSQVLDQISHPDQLPTRVLSLYISTIAAQGSLSKLTNEMRQLEKEVSHNVLYTIPPLTAYLIGLVRCGAAIEAFHYYEEMCYQKPTLFKDARLVKPFEKALQAKGYKDKLDKLQILLKESKCDIDNTNFSN